jgi:NAD dependent epimerase/dehydratase
LAPRLVTKGQRVDCADKRVVVTGADGFIGSHLTEALAKAGAQVRALSLYNSFGTNGWLDELTSELAASVTIVRGDVRDPDLMRRLCRDADIVFHLAALIAIPYSYEAVQSYVDVNVKGTVNLFEAARAGGCARIVTTSTSEVYGTARFTPIAESHPLQGQSPYSASKIGADMMAEAYARSFDLPVVILRPFNTYGPRQSERAVIPTVIRQALDPACEAIFLGDLTPRRDFTFVADTVRGFLFAGLADLDYGVPYNCGTGRTVSIGETADAIIRITGCNKPIEMDPARKRPKNSEVMELVADASRLAEKTGWSAGTTLEEGLSVTIDWWRDRIARGAVRPTTGYLT